MQSSILCVFLAFGAFLLQGCEFFDALTHMSYLWVECMDPVYEGSLPDKMKALAELPGLCGDAEDCVEGGTECIEVLYNITVFISAADCFETVGNSTDFSVEPNITASTIPADVQEWYSAAKDEVQRNISAVLDTIIETYRNGSTCDEVEFQQKYDPRAAAHLQSLRRARRPFPAASVSFGAAVALLGMAALWRFRRAAQVRGGGGDVASDQEMLLE
eukprot:CAMPEP_0179277958 /NCGR_PEP_ID=MMETSP0797-20121207/35361_1 /TAXON_ID=47934 /ORGANISM="Dinophysis acuminata, Strain DAEP01" /LENGTH=216 /DNA_ID=CAMNT_0020986561 /DNA_START=73 /DNA_END=723 /DNA_ORIENTATION=-